MHKFCVMAECYIRDADWFSSNPKYSKYTKKIILFNCRFCFRWKTVHLPFPGMSVAFCPVRRIDPALPETHRSKTVQMPGLWEMLCPIRPFGTSHEKAHAKRTEKSMKSITCEFFVFAQKCSSNMCQKCFLIKVTKTGLIISADDQENRRKCKNKN